MLIARSLLNRIQNAEVGDTRPNGVQPGGQQGMRRITKADNKKIKTSK
jgi:hypothetical protein